MTNINNYNTYTIALDSNGKVLLCTENSSLGGQFFLNNASNAETIIIGENVENSVTAFLDHKNLKKIYILNQNYYNSVNNYFNGRGYKNWADTPGKVTVTKIDNIESLNYSEITIDNEKYFIKNGIIPVSLFGVNGDGTDEAEKINDAVAYVVNNGGNLLFEGDATYAISSPILIYSPPDTSTKPEFDIDFNHCRITVANDSILSGGEDLADSMIYVNYDIIDSQKTGIVKNVQLNPGIYQDNNISKPRAETGLHIASALNVRFENFKILDATTGVYIEDNSSYTSEDSVVLDNIHISKTRTFEDKISQLDFVFDDGELLEEFSAEIANDYENCKRIGIDCKADNCSFNNIIVIDYLVGMRVDGENNDIYGAHIWNTYCPEQYKYSVGFINGGADNIYTACVADKFHIGWLSSDTANFTLTNCHWLNKEVRVNGVVYGNEAYGFYIPDGIVDDYGDNEIGGNITANDCYMVGSDLDNDNCFTNFCNRKDHSINYTGTTANIFYAPIPEMQKFVDSENNIHDFENKVTFNQYGKIKTKSIEIFNTEDENFNVYKLDADNFDFDGEEELIFSTNGYMDNITNANGTNGTIINGICTNTTITKVNDDIEMTVHNQNDTYNVSSNIKIDLNDIGYQTGDVGCIAFDYYTQAEDTSNGDVFQDKEFFIDSNEKVVDYFTGDLIEKVSLEQSTVNDSDNFKSMACLFEITDYSGSMKMYIGHGDRIIIDENNNLVTDENGAPILKRTNQNPIIIKNLRIIKIPSELNLEKIPKYYLETEEKYRKRVANAFISKNSTITKNASGFDVLTIPAYSQSHPAYQRYGEDTQLAFVSLPFENKVYGHQTNDNQYIPPCTLSYTALGRPRFNGNIVKRGDVPYGKTLTRPYLSLVYDVDPCNIFLTASAKYPSYAVFAKEEDVGQVDGEYFKEEQAIIGADNTKNDDYLGVFWYSNFQNLEIKDKTTIWNSIFLPVYEVGNPYLPKLNDNTIEEPYIITNLINNPFGYYFETPIDVGGSSVEIPLYVNGEIRLVLKNAEYSTDLPTVFYEVEYSNTQENNS